MQIRLGEKLSFCWRKKINYYGSCSDGRQDCAGGGGGGAVSGGTAAAKMAAQALLPNESHGGSAGGGGCGAVSGGTAAAKMAGRIGSPACPGPAAKRKPWRQRRRRWRRGCERLHSSGSNGSLGPAAKRKSWRQHRGRWRRGCQLGCLRTPH